MRKVKNRKSATEDVSNWCSQNTRNIVCLSLRAPTQIAEDQRKGVRTFLEQHDSQNTSGMTITRIDTIDSLSYLYPEEISSITQSIEAM